jgi:hypothetical protein
MDARRLDRNHAGMLDRNAFSQRSLVIQRLFVWLVADGLCWFVLREKYGWLVAGDWFVLREKYCWLVAGKLREQGVRLCQADAANT